MKARRRRQRHIPSPLGFRVRPPDTGDSLCSFFSVNGCDPKPWTEMSISEQSRLKTVFQGCCWQRVVPPNPPPSVFITSRHAGLAPPPPLLFSHSLTEDDPPSHDGTGDPRELAAISLESRPERPEPPEMLLPSVSVPGAIESDFFLNSSDGSAEEDDSQDGWPV
jgi:hypothetical protein